MQILAEGLVGTVRHIIRCAIAWLLKKDRPHCPNEDCLSELVIPTGKIFFQPEASLSKPYLFLVLHQYLCLKSQDTFLDR